MLLDYFDHYAQSHRAYKGGNWCYEDGCLYRGMELLHRATGDSRWFDHTKRLADQQIGAGPSLLGYALSDYNIDNVMAGRALLYLHQETGAARYLESAALLIDQLASQPRTKSGVYWHKLRYPWQIWLDGLYMGLPFQIAYGKRVGDDSLVTDALAQFETALAETYVAETGLYAHAVDEARQQPWADTGTGHPAAHWARALGWLSMALVDVATLVGPEAFAPLAPRASDLFKRIAGMRQPSGLWLQVIDQPDLKGNYPESSAAAMFVYALMKAKGLGLWHGDVSLLCKDLVAAAVHPKAGGGLEMTDICEVAGLGRYQDRYRDGSAGYYISEAVVSDDTKGVGPLMMCVATAMDMGLEVGRPLDLAPA